MDAKASANDQMVPFKSPRRFLADLDPSETSRVVSSAADVALVIDNGVIKDIALANGELSREGYANVWRGKKWVETVTVESRPKIEELLRTKSNDQVHWRQVNHPSATGVDIPIKYAAIRTGPNDRIVALGRELKSVSALQQRLVEAHQGLERDYDRLREAENRYQNLFFAVSEPILIVDSESLEIEEGNPAAATWFSKSLDALRRTDFESLFGRKNQRVIQHGIANALASGAAVSDSIETAGAEFRLSISPFRQGDKTRLIVRIVEHGRKGEGDSTAMLGVLEKIPDGLVIVGSDLMILEANAAFNEMTGMSGARQAVGKRLSDFLGRSATDLNVLFSGVDNYGFVRNFATVLRDQFGAEEKVEVSAVTAPLGDAEVYGLSIRNIARRLGAGSKIGVQLPSSADQLTELVGKVSLKEIVRESTDLIERLCIEAALEITDDNRASAAEMLGLSRQGLYSKLKRFGLDG